AMQVIWDDGDNVCGNPAPVVDEESGDVFLLTTWNLGEDHESEIIAETSKDGRRIFSLSSKDHGKNWSAPKEITKDVKQDNWTWYATGPVHGIQLEHGPNRGRLMIPCDHIESGTKRYYSHVIYSDDHGSSWALGGTTPLDQVNECSLAERSNGELVLNMRNYARQAGQARQVAISKDGGLSWQDQRIDPQLAEPRCQGALLNVERKGKTYFLFSNPANDSSRVNMTLSISDDEGKTWAKKHTIYPAFSAYSDLVEMADGRILILHEGGQKSPYEAIWASTYNWE
ncbi:MAG: exo-alpha-sialidase, partial [Bacteroidia bacterium]